ncbi:MAG: hypothetical protein FWH21_03300 [Kiritimatiellaeota bacterium]|nr:hypothetical protein [Kiritimatiellota bacterium]
MTLMFPQRKRPPHFVPVERHNEPIILFVTLAIQPRVNVLANDVFHEVFKEALNEADAWRVFLYLVMPDHVHLFTVPQTLPPFPIVKWAEFLKRKITQRLARTLALQGCPQWRWQPGCWDTQIRSLENLDEKASYVRMNPVRAGLCVSPDEWKWRGEGEWAI